MAENLDPQAQALFTLDGEAFPFTSFHVEVHPRLANILSLEGHFFISDFLKKNHAKE
jgi:sphingosine kinase